MSRETVERPDHLWNDPDEDGHNCVDCPPDSPWKCYESDHPHIELGDPYDLIPPEDRLKLFQDLEEGARARRRGEDNARNLPLP